MHYSPDQIAKNFCIPEMGYVPPLREQFPKNSPEEFREALQILRADYAGKRDQWEEKWDLAFPEFAYAGRLHPLSERKQAELMRPMLLSPESFQFSGVSTQRLTEYVESLSQDDRILFEIECTQRWTMEELLRRLEKLKIPVSVHKEGSAPKPLKLAATDHLECLPEELKALALEARSRYVEKHAELSARTDFAGDTLQLKYTLERYESLSYQCGLLKKK